MPAHHFKWAKRQKPLLRIVLSVNTSYASSPQSKPRRTQNFQTFLIFSRSQSNCCSLCFFFCVMLMGLWIARSIYALPESRWDFTKEFWILKPISPCNTTGNLSNKEKSDEFLSWGSVVSPSGCNLCFPYCYKWRYGNSFYWIIRLLF